MKGVLGQKNVWWCGAACVGVEECVVRWCWVFWGNRGCGAGYVGAAEGVVGRCRVWWGSRGCGEVVQGVLGQ